jgi:hypothetical protein
MVANKLPTFVRLSGLILTLPLEHTRAEKSIAIVVGLRRPTLLQRDEQEQIATIDYKSARPPYSLSELEPEQTGNPFT